MRLRELESDAVFEVLGHLRPEDEIEVKATRPGLDALRSAVADELANRSVGCSVWIGDDPVAVFGVAKARDGVGSVWFLSKESFKPAGLQVTRRLRREMIPLLRGMGYHRVECASWEGHTEAHRWIELLGGVLEARLARFGSGGEDFRLYRWLI